jgi:excisionase family DNA binding protein
VTMDADDTEWLTVAEVADRFGVGAPAVRSWVARGLLPAARRPAPGTRGNTRILIRRADVRAFAERYYRGRARPAWLHEPD